jgi:hypothetical protein
MTDRKTYSDPSQGTGQSGSERKDDRSPERDRAKNLGDRNIGSRHGEGGSAESPGGRSSDMERER